MLCFGASGARGRVPSSAGWDGGGAAGATAARPMYPSCSASLCVCLHHRLVTCSFQPATACDRSGARDRSSHRRGGEAMAAAAYPGTRHQPVLGVRDASGARGGFCRRRGWTTDATAARCDRPDLPGNRVARPPFSYIVEGDPISACKSFWASGASSRGIRTGARRKSPIGPPLDARLHLAASASTSSAVVVLAAKGIGGSGHGSKVVVAAKRQSLFIPKETEKL